MSWLSFSISNALLSLTLCSYFSIHFDFCEVIDTPSRSQRSCPPSSTEEIDFEFWRPPSKKVNTVSEIFYPYSPRLHMFYEEGLPFLNYIHYKVDDNNFNFSVRRTESHCTGEDLRICYIPTAVSCDCRSTSFSEQ